MTNDNFIPSHVQICTTHRGWLALRDIPLPLAASESPTTLNEVLIGTCAQLVETTSSEALQLPSPRSTCSTSKLLLAVSFSGFLNSYVPLTSSSPSTGSLWWFSSNPELRRMRLHMSAHNIPIPAGSGLYRLHIPPCQCSALCWCCLPGPPNNVTW